MNELNMFLTFCRAHIIMFLVLSTQNVVPFHFRHLNRVFMFSPAIHLFTHFTYSGL